jgi:hypothetical protein
MNQIIKDMVPVGTEWEVFETRDSMSYSCRFGQLHIHWHETYGRLDMRMGDAYMSVDFGECYDPELVRDGAIHMQAAVSGMVYFLRSNE